MNLINLKLHTDYSLLEGVGSIEEYISKAKEYGQKVLGITDTSMFGTIKFYNLCKKNNIKPIIGLEVSIKGVRSEGFYSLTLIAKNLDGLQEISKISTISYENEKNGQLFVNLGELKNLRNTYILSGGIKSEAFKYILENKKEDLKELLLFLNEELENIYFEIPAFIISQNQVYLINNLYDEIEIEPIITNDVYYVNKDDRILQKIFAAIKTNRNLKTVQNDIKVTEIYFKDEYDTIYSEDLEKKAFLNINKLISDINIEILENHAGFPSVEIPKGLNEREYIEELIEKTIYTKYKGNTDIARNRVKYELDIIENMGYIKYFLIVYDFIKYAKENDIYVGPGRGSAAGSIISYLLNITEVDPIKYELFFERFLNPHRISMPDIDVDIEQEKRQELIEYIKRKYSIRNFSQIMTFSTYKPRLAIKDVAKVMEIPEKNIKGIIKEAAYGLENIFDNRESVKLLISYAKRIEEKNKNLSTHAAGIILTKEDIRETLPLIYNDYSKDYQIQYEAEYLEKLGYLKMDILGLKNLNIVKSTVKRANLDIDIYNLPDDKKAFDLFNRGNNLGIFQCESYGITELGKKLKINSIDDIALLLALYRPGPLKSGYIDTLIDIKNNGKEIKYIHPIVEEVLKSTYGVLVYQEQIMQLAYKISNYSLAEGDELRKAIGKKNIELLNKNREIFISRAIIPKDIASKIYDLIEKFGDYGFNKAHAISYAKITYQTAYLKANYPLEFYASVLSSELKDESKLLRTYMELNDRNMELLSPDINKSTDVYESFENKLLMPLSSIKEMSEKTSRDIVNERNANGEYKDFLDFCLRNRGLNKTNIEGLIYAGCFDKFNYNRKTLIENLVRILKWRDKKIKSEEDIAGQLFYGVKTGVEDYKIEEIDEYSYKELTNLEKEYIKINLRELKYINNHKLSKLILKSSSYILGIVSDIKYIKTKKDQMMAELTITTAFNIVKHIIFPKQYLEYFDKIRKDKLNIFKLEKLQDNKYCIAQIINPYDFSNYKLILNLEDKNIDKVKELIYNNKGNNRVTIYKKEDGKIKKYELSEKYSVLLSKSFISQLVEEIGLENIKLKLT